MESGNETGSREDKRDNQDRAATLGSTRSESPTFGNESDGINYPSSPGGDHQREDIDQTNPEGSIGKILSQVREIEREHLAYVGAHKKRLETRLNDAEEHERKFTNQVQAVEEQIRSLMESLQ